MIEAGDIVVVKGVIFNGSEHTQGDLKTLRGRPCIILTEKDENYYMVPMSRKENSVDNRYDFRISRSNIIFESKYRFADTSYARVSELMKRESYQYNLIGRLYDTRYYRLLKKFLQYHQELRENPNIGEYYEEIYEDLKEKSRVLKKG